VLPLPKSLKGGAANKVIDSLIKRGLIEEIKAKRDQPTWGDAQDGQGVTLIATDAAFDALGIETDPTNKPKPEKTVKAKRGKQQPKQKAERAPRSDSKQAQMIAMLKRAKGASIEELAEAFGWQHHTVRGAIAGALKKKLGLNVTSDKDEKRGRVYRIEA
jgi:DNA-binding MarR family transcriptional regulator